MTQYNDRYYIDAQNSIKYFNLKQISYVKSTCFQTNHLPYLTLKSKKTNLPPPHTHTKQKNPFFTGATTIKLKGQRKSCLINDSICYHFISSVDERTRKEHI